MKILANLDTYIYHVDLHNTTAKFKDLELITDGKIHFDEFQNYKHNLFHDKVNLTYRIIQNDKSQLVINQSFIVAKRTLH